MRGEIFLRFKKIASAIFFLSLMWDISGQELPDEIISVVEDMAASLSESAVEELTMELEHYLVHPLCINVARREDFERLGLLGLFQIESIIDYRKTFGDILSAGELAFVDGFNPAFVAKLTPFISFESEYSIGETIQRRHFDTEIIAKGKKKYTKPGISLSTKIISSYGSHAASLVFDNDAGEGLTQYYLPDFTSAHYRYSKDGFDFIVGDYTAKFGQGLVLWKSFPVSFAGTPSSLAKRGKGLTGYISFDEDNYLRGVASAIEVGSGKVSILTSARMVDARIDGECYTSIVTGGSHVSSAELAKRHTMAEYLAGINYTINLKNVKFGITAVAYEYNKHNGRKVADYNRYQMYDGLWGNAGFDFYGFYNKFRYFGEIAFDAQFAPATIVGIIWSPKYELETGLTCRYYDKSYIATHSGAFSTISSISNQAGLTFGLKWLCNDRITVNCYSDGAYYPWQRFNISFPSFSSKNRISFEYDNNQRLTISAITSYNISGVKDDSAMNGSALQITSSKLIFKLKSGYTLSNFKIETTFTANLHGYAAFMGTTYTGIRNKMQLSAGITRYNTPDWDSRIYLYEKGMPQTFSLEAFYGNGWSWYAMMKYAPNYKYKFYVKVSDRYSSFLIRIFIPG